uniref:helix-turn-helix domain-containing protein n=2 Tax=Candidatus Planktophila sp. TaxID=2175601 RepID=UPI004049334C
MSLGSMLTKARKDAGFSIDDLSDATNIRGALLREMEADEFTNCGGETYARGHLRNIAKKLNIDAQPFLDAYESEQGQSVRSIQDLWVENSLMEEPGEPRKASWEVLAGISVASLLVIGLAQVIFTSSSDSPIPTPITTPNATSSVSEDQSEIVSDGTKVEIVITASRARSYLLISDESGQALFDGQIAQGEEKIYSSTSKLTLKVGNAGAIDLKVNGKTVPPIGTSGQVVTVTYGLDS